MSEVTVENLAKAVGTPTDIMLLQMKEAGLNQSSVSDLVTDEDKKTLLNFLKNQQKKSTKTIKLKKGSLSDTPKKTSIISIKRKKVSNEVQQEIDSSQDTKGIEAGSPGEPSGDAIAPHRREVYSIMNDR